MKKVLAIFLTLIMVFGATAAFAADITVKVNDEVVTFDREPYAEDGEVYIPFRFVAEKLGATVAWDKDTKTVFAVLDDAVTTLQIGNKNIFTNAGTFATEAAPFIVIDRTFVTEDVIKTTLGAEVSFDAEASIVTITK